jgi:hypothetical protein
MRYVYGGVAFIGVSSFSSSHPSSPCRGCWARLAMPRDPYIREKFTRDLSFARQLAREYFQRYPKERYEIEVESWWIQSQNVEFRPRRRRQSAPKFGSDACLMTASRIMLHRAIVLREGQFSRAHTFVV